MTQFNVLLYDFNRREVKVYDVLPYFRTFWKDSHTKKEIVDKLSFKAWVEKMSQYQFWARCEYEFLMAPWPIGSKKTSEALENFLTPEFNINDYKQNIDFWNIITRDFYKIDIHQQIMMNIDIITDLLYKEFYDTNKVASVK